LENPEKVYDIKVRCYEFSKAVVLFLNKYEFKKVHYPIINQLLRSATSIGANIIEGKPGNSKKNMVNFFSIALRSANESKYWLCLVRDTMGINKEEINLLLKEANEISKIIGKSILTLKQKQES
jgi:four helix bundle protein